MSQIGTFSEINLSDGWSIEVINGNLAIFHNSILKDTWYPSSNKQKILCLHGGGGTATTMQTQLNTLASELNDSFEFIYLNAPYTNGLWIKDPPNGKDDPTTDPDWAQNSIDVINQTINDDTYYAIIGYSQGGAFIPVYLSNLDDPNSKFQKILICSGYLPSTHQGLIDKINATAPFTSNTLIYRGNDDYISSNMINDLSTVFSVKTVIDSTDPDTGHFFPKSNSDDFITLKNFLTN